VAGGVPYTLQQTTFTCQVNSARAHDGTSYGCDIVSTSLSPAKSDWREYEIPVPVTQPVIPQRQRDATLHTIHEALLNQVSTARGGRVSDSALRAAAEYPTSSTSLECSMLPSANVNFQSRGKEHSRAKMYSPCGVMFPQAEIAGKYGQLRLSWARSCQAYGLCTIESYMHNVCYQKRKNALYHSRIIRHAVEICRSQCTVTKPTIHDPNL